MVCAEVQNNQQLDREILFTYSTAVGTASQSDFTAISVTLSFDPTNDQQAMCMDVQTIEDLLAEGGESFTVTLGTSAAGVTLSPMTATVNIQDNDVDSKILV